MADVSLARQGVVWVLAVGVILFAGFTVTWSPPPSERLAGSVPASPTPSISTPPIVGSLTAPSSTHPGPATLGANLRLPPEERSATSSGQAVSVPFALVLLVLLVMVPVLVLRGVTRRRGRQGRVGAKGSLAGGEGEGGYAAVVRHLIRDTAARRRLLEGDDPRSGVLRAWLDVQEAAARSGLARHDSETSGEFTARVLMRWDVDPAALTTLSSAYREAQFSDHQISEETRSRVAEALQQVERATGDPSLRLDQL